jgi:TorA maturation chaperone TorD
MSATTLGGPHLQRPATQHDDLDLIRVFAFCFGSPTSASYAWLSGTESDALWKDVGRHFRIVLKSNGKTNFADFAGYEAAYIALFEVGVPGPPVPLLESAHSHRAVPQAIVLDCVNFYDVLGLRPSGSAFPADHLVTQLEFLAAVRYLRGEQPDPDKAKSLWRLERDFLERHLLNWLPVVQKKIDELNPPLFPMLLRLLLAYLSEEYRVLAIPDRS